MPFTTVSMGPMTWNTTGSWRYLRPRYVEKIPACTAACPACEPIERWIGLLEEGNVNAAWDILTCENPFPGLMGRVCFHPCQTGCNRKDNGGAVTINMLERHLADSRGYENISVKKWRQSTGKKLAVVGSGPAGLAFAYFSARLGHSVEVFERFPKAGGLFRYGIPEYRLPKKIVDKEIKKLYDLGVNFHCGKNLTKEEIEALQSKYDGVFVACGAHTSRSLGAEGENTLGVMPALEFLEQVQLFIDKEALAKEPKDLGNVIVVGGGNSAVDAARTAVRFGAKSVTILYRRSRAEMPAYVEEVNDAENEGVKLDILAAPKRVISKDGRVIEIECIKMELGAPDESGRRSPVPVKGSEFIVKADLVLTAIGEMVDKKLSFTQNEKFLLGGDMLDIPRTVVSAIGSGKLAAIKTDVRLTGKNFTEVFEQIRVPEADAVRMLAYLQLIGAGEKKTEKYLPKVEVIRSDKLNTYYFEESAPANRPKLPTESRLVPNPLAEIHTPLTAQMASEQLARCMHCGHCTKCDNCLIYCPDISIEKACDGYDIDFDFCKGCGVCVKECPRGAMEMIEEPMKV